MLKQVSGDILLSKAQVIAHGVAPGDHFNQGLALQLRKQYPAMAKDFRHYCQVSHPKPGELWTWADADGRRVVNLLTQEEAKNKKGHPGKATMHNIDHCLRALNKLSREESFSSIALPKLATGVGGLAWSEVSEAIERHLSDLDIPIYIYSEYHANVVAEEPQ